MGWFNTIDQWYRQNMLLFWSVVVAIVIIFFTVRKMREKRKEKKDALRWSIARQSDVGTDGPILDRYMEIYGGHYSFKWALYRYVHPDGSKQALSKLVEALLATEAFRQESVEGEKVSIAGWTIAALGKSVVLHLNPHDIENGFSRLTKIFGEYNRAVENYNHLLNAYRNPREGEQQPSARSVEEALNKINKGILPFLRDEDHATLFAFIINTMNNNGENIHNFIKQGCIMGIQDWLIDNSTNSKVKKYCDMVSQRRSELIATGDMRSFFEVRVPSDCVPEEYAEILRVVLKASNPSMTYCDTKKLMQIAVREIPGVMQLLTEYPLRLIDAANLGLEGFYQFSPYDHTLVTRFQGIKPTGTVTARYHVIADMTVPNSSGLNVRLFSDEYSAVPVLFHEYSHYKGDRNEASVFLKTCVFSRRYYKKYQDAKAQNDAVFTVMSKTLGKKAHPQKADDLNMLIRRYYGDELTQEQAEQKALREIQQLNVAITKQFNEKETWCPDIKYPLFEGDTPPGFSLVEKRLLDGPKNNKLGLSAQISGRDLRAENKNTNAGDTVNRDKIYEILVRYGMSKKSLTKQEFARCLKKYMPSRK